MNKDIKNDKKARKPKIDTFPKLILVIVELHGMACVTASYILAFLNHMTVVENLSVTIVGQIVSPLIAYILGNVVSNALEKNQWTFSTPLSAIESGIVQSPTTPVYTDVELEPEVGTVDNPINLDTLPLFEFGDCSDGKGSD